MLPVLLISTRCRRGCNLSGSNNFRGKQAESILLYYMCLHERSDYARASLLGSIAKAFWSSDAAFATTLLCAQPASRQHLEMRHCISTLVNPLEFENLISHVALSSAGQAVERLPSARNVSSSRRTHIRQRREYYRRVQALWAPFDRTMQLQAIGRREHVSRGFHGNFGSNSHRKRFTLWMVYHILPFEY